MNWAKTGSPGSIVSNFYTFLYPQLKKRPTLVNNDLSAEGLYSVYPITFCRSSRIIDLIRFETGETRLDFIWIFSERLRSPCVCDMGNSCS